MRIEITGAHLIEEGDMLLVTVPSHTTDEAASYIAEELRNRVPVGCTVTVLTGAEVTVLRQDGD